MVTLSRVSKDDDFVASMLSAIPSEVLARGVPSEAELEAEFPRVKAACRQLAHVPEYGGILSYTLSYVISALSFERHGLVEGDHADAILARADYFIAKRDLDMVRTTSCGARQSGIFLFLFVHAHFVSPKPFI
jgi:hypothetical protein